MRNLTGRMSLPALQLMFAQSQLAISAMTKEVILPLAPPQLVLPATLATQAQPRVLVMEQIGNLLTHAKVRQTKCFHKWINRTD